MCNSSFPSNIFFFFFLLERFIWLFKIITGFTTNERINFWRYKYFQSSSKSPFSLGWMQNFVDLINRKILWYIPTNLDWSRIYTFEDFNESLPLRLRRSTNSSKHLLNV
jgi:hypothetical protein